MNTIGGTLRTNTVGDDDYKKSIEERRERNVLLDLSIQCVELMGYEMIGEDGMPAKGVVTRYYSIEEMSDDYVILHLYDLTVLYGMGSLCGIAWDTKYNGYIKELIRDFLWNYYMTELVYDLDETDIIIIMKSFLEYVRSEENAEKEETT